MADVSWLMSTSENPQIVLERTILVLSSRFLVSIFSTPLELLVKLNSAVVIKEGDTAYLGGLLCQQWFSSKPLSDKLLIS